jgi:hypothetical protein
VTVSVRDWPKLPGVPVIFTWLRCSPATVCHAPASAPMPETVTVPVPTYEMLYVPEGSWKPRSV